jgi:hypothetical protein
VMETKIRSRILQSFLKLPAPSFGASTRARQ